MAAVTILADGNLSVMLTTREQEFLKMLSEEQGETALQEVFNLWINTRVQALVATRMNKLAPADQLDFITKLAAAKHVKDVPKP